MHLVRNALFARFSRIYASAAVVLTATLGACSSGSTTTSGPEGPITQNEPQTADDSGTAPVDGAVPGPATAASNKKECETYLSCINEAQPAQGGAAVTLYGDSSACWKGSEADAKRCGDACHTLRVDIGREGTRYPSCGCSTNAECSTNLCSATNTCVTNDRVDEYKARIQENNICKSALTYLDQQIKPLFSNNSVIKFDCIAAEFPDCGSLIDWSQRYIPSDAADYAAVTSSNFTLHVGGTGMKVGSCSAAAGITLLERQSQRRLFPQNTNRTIYRR